MMTFALQAAIVIAATLLLLFAFWPKKKVKYDPDAWAKKIAALPNGSKYYNSDGSFNWNGFQKDIIIPLGDICRKNQFKMNNWKSPWLDKEAWEARIKHQEEVAKFYPEYPRQPVSYPPIPDGEYGSVVYLDNETPDGNIIIRQEISTYKDGKLISKRVIKRS